MVKMVFLWKKILDLRLNSFSVSLFDFHIRAFSIEIRVRLDASPLSVCKNSDWQIRQRFL